MPTEAIDRRTVWRRRLLLASLVPLAAVLILLAPAPDPDEIQQQFAEYVMVTPRLGFALNGDAWRFMQSAEHPGMLLEPRFFYQSRPLIIVTGHVIGRVMHLVRPGASLSLAPHAGWWMPFLVLNAVVLVASVWLFDAAVTPPAGSVVTALLAVLLLVNEIVRWFLCSPHTQLLILVAPLVCLALARSIIASPTVMTGRRALLLGTAIGALVLGYGAFLVCIPVVVIASLLRPERARSGTVTPLAMFVAASIAPTVAWYGVVRALTGSVYSAEVVVYRQFVWPADAFASGTLLATALANVRDFAATSLPVMEVPLGLLAVTSVCAWWAGVGPGSLLAGARAATLAAVVTLVCETSFLYGMGYYQRRLSLGMMPAVLALADLTAAAAWPRLPRRGRGLLVGTIAIAVGWWTVRVLMQAGPAG